MKTFIVLTFIGILTYGYADNIPAISECKTVTPMEGFSATNFFNGKWYVTHVQSVTSPTVCQTFDTSKTADGKYVTEFKYNKEGVENRVHCEATREPVAKKLSFRCQNGPDTFQSEFIVLGTDFNDYAVFYRCVTFASGVKADNYLVVSKKSGNEEIPAQAQSLITDLNLQKCSDLRTAKKVV